MEHISVIDIRAAVPVCAALHRVRNKKVLILFHYVCLQVTLHLTPIPAISVHHKPLVFILNSPRPVTWELKTERLAAGVPRFFFVSIVYGWLRNQLKWYAATYGINMSGCFILSLLKFIQRHSVP